MVPTLCIRLRPNTVQTLTILNQTFDFGGHGCTHPWNFYGRLRGSHHLHCQEMRRATFRSWGVGFLRNLRDGGCFWGPQNHPGHCLWMGKTMALGSPSPYFRKAPLPRERLSPATQQRQLWLCPCHGCRTGIGEVLKSIFVAATCGYPCLSGSHFITFLLVDEKMVPFAAIG